MAENKESDVVEEEKNCKLTYYFRDLLKERINFQIPREETVDIVRAIETLVSIILGHVTSKVHWLPFSRLLKVGSMAERTSIVFPDEFDYLAIYKQNGMQVERVCKEDRGYAHIKVTDPDLKKRWCKWLRGDYLQAYFKTHGFAVMLPEYFDTLGNAFMYEVSQISKSVSDVGVCPTTTGLMRIDKRVQKNGPAFTQHFLWEPYTRQKRKRTIKVDITPAIEFDLNDDIINENDTFHTDVLNKTVKHGKFMLVLTHDQGPSCPLCFRLTFTETEVDLVRCLDTHHKDCYKLLKFIFNSGGGVTFLSSYVFKTLVLKHGYHCKETANLAVCFKQLVAVCLHYLFNRKTEEKIEVSRLVRLFMRGEKFKLHIPSIFIKGHNIMDSKDFQIPCEQFLLGIERMLQSVEEICFAENPKVDDIVIVNSHMTAFVSYAKSSQLVNKHLELQKCISIIQQYFNSNVLE
ncbi:uncharacterized protein LOC132727628 [Ruditapes philippinarum]|uniref:uncharacterized protein LOC132727628 n=1 Tax=Ruditapes philippinarum TaxID=129788 RepID=UPI00295A9C72|nr:uncharacterized protein LOC132727628 [Ruditapes philippinarum]